MQVRTPGTTGLQVSATLDDLVREGKVRRYPCDFIDWVHRR